MEEARVWEVLREYVLFDTGTAMSRTPKPQSHENGNAPPSSPIPHLLGRRRGLAKLSSDLCAEMATRVSSLLDGYYPKTAALQRMLLWRLANPASFFICR